MIRAEAGLGMGWAPCLTLLRDPLLEARGLDEDEDWIDVLEVGMVWVLRWELGGEMVWVVRPVGGAQVVFGRVVLRRSRYTTPPSWIPAVARLLFSC